jgi:hypothetical protein
MAATVFSAQAQQPPVAPGGGVSPGERPLARPGRLSSSPPDAGPRPPSPPGTGGGTVPPVNLGPGAGVAPHPASPPGTGGGTVPPVNLGPGAGVTPPPASLPGTGGGTVPPVNLGPGAGVAPHPASPPGADGGTAPGMRGYAGVAAPIPYSFRGRDVSLFNPREMGAWRRGHWRREWHNGRLGWWWNVGGSWFLYPQTFYPYPPYVSEEIFEAGYPVAGYWYYCDDPPGFYPYVPVCWFRWRAVPAEPQ